MNDDEIEGALRQATCARPSRELDRRMGALFDAGAPRRSWILPLLQPLPVWVLAAACILSAAGGFFANALWQPRRAPAGAPASIAICMLDPNRPLARRFLGPAWGETPIRLSDYTIKVHATDKEEVHQP